MIHIYTGNGKGKTTAALGLSLRVIGAGKKVLMAQFLKTVDTSEVKTIKKFLSSFDVKCFGRKGFISLTDPNLQIISEPTNDKSAGNPESIIYNPKSTIQKDIDLAHQALEYASKAVKSKKYDLIILDEINVALDFGLLKLEEVIDFIKNVPEDLESVLTGRNAKPEIIKLADLVTEMKMVKHYYNKGVGVRKGVEY